MSQESNYPILYSLQHCPYAMRARMGILMAQQTVLLRAVVTKNKPPEMLAISPKGTVPVLLLNHDLKDSERVIDESLDIMLWALGENDPQDLLYCNFPSGLSAMLQLVKENDHVFKPILEKYKRARRFSEVSEKFYRRECEVFIESLEQRLNGQEYLLGDGASLADYALLPFVRQFSRVDKKWFSKAPYPNLRKWLVLFLQSPFFTKVMAKYPLWLDTHEECLYGPT